MAKYIEDFNSKLDWAMPFQRTGKFPLDRSTMFDSYEDAVKYALGAPATDSRGLGGTSYVGQLIVVFENDIVTVCKINADRTIEALTSASGVDADILDLQTQINNEIALRKLIEGQSGQTYVDNATATYIKDATSLNNADVMLDNAIANLKMTAATASEVSSLGENVREAYKLIDGNSTQHGDYIKIYKDSSLSKVEFDNQALTFTYNLSNGSTTAVTIDVSSFLAESEFSNGLQVVDHKVSVKLANDSESFLSVNANGIKLSGVQNAINATVNNLNTTASGSSNHINVSVTQTNGKVNSVSVDETDIASASALTAETNARELINSKIIAAVGLNSDGTFKKPTTTQTSGYTTASTSVMDAIIILDNQVEENETVTAYALTDLNNRLLYYEGHNSVSSLTTVPTTKRLCIATISSSQTLGLNGTINDGRELHIIVKNTNTNDVTITIPSTIKNLVGENLTIGGSSYGEINLTTDGTDIYYRGIGV